MKSTGKGNFRNYDNRETCPIQRMDKLNEKKDRRDVVTGSANEHKMNWTVLDFCRAANDESL